MTVSRTVAESIVSAFEAGTSQDRPIEITDAFWLVSFPSFGWLLDVGAEDHVPVRDIAIADFGDDGSYLMIRLDGAFLAVPVMQEVA